MRKHKPIICLIEIIISVFICLITIRFEVRCSNSNFWCVFLTGCFKKDVLTKIHGGGATDRKRKLLEKQKTGKARAKQFGKVEIPQEAFIGVLKINKDN